MVHHTELSWPPITQCLAQATLVTAKWNAGAQKRPGDVYRRGSASDLRNASSIPRGASSHLSRHRRGASQQWRLIRGSGGHRLLRASRKPPRPLRNETLERRSTQQRKRPTQHPQSPTRRQQLPIAPQTGRQSAMVPHTGLRRPPITKGLAQAAQVTEG